MGRETITVREKAIEAIKFCAIAALIMNNISHLAVVITALGFGQCLFQFPDFIFRLVTSP